MSSVQSVRAGTSHAVPTGARTGLIEESQTTRRTSDVGTGPMTALVFFRDDWPAVGRRLDATLARRGVSAADREDIVQEAAYRLYRAWDQLDPARPVEPYVRVIALNVWYAQGRSPVTSSEVLGAVPDMVSLVDVERTCLARDELHQVCQAVERLRPEQQQLLRDVAAEELGTHREHTSSIATDALRMARMRARKQLRALLTTPLAGAEPVAAAV